MTAREIAEHMKTIAEHICDGKLVDRTGRRREEINLTACLAVLTIEKQLLHQVAKGWTLDAIEDKLCNDYPEYFARIALPAKRSALRQLLCDLGLVKSA